MGWRENSRRVTQPNVSPDGMNVGVVPVAAPRPADGEVASDWRSRSRKVDLDAQAAAASKANPPSKGLEVGDVQYLDGPAGKVRAFARNVVPGADYVAAAGDYVQDRLPEALGGKPEGQERSWQETFLQNRAFNKASESVNPGTAAAGALAQGAAIGTNLPGQGLKAAAKRTLAEGVTGGANALGRSEAPTWQGKVADAGKGALVSSVVAGVAEPVATAVTATGRAVRSGIENEAKTGAVRAAGATGGDFSKLRSDPAGKARIENIAKDLHEEGIVKPWASPREMEDALTAKQMEWGQHLGRTYAELDRLHAYGNVTRIKQHADAVADAFRKTAGADNANIAAKALDEEAQHLIANVAQNRQFVPLSELHRWRGDVDKLVYGYAGTKDPTQTVKGQALSRWREVLDEELQKGADYAIQANGRQDLADALAVGNQKYRSMVTAREWAADAASKADASKPIPIFTIGLGGGALTSLFTGNLPLAGALGATTAGSIAFRKVVEPRLPATLASGARSYMNPGPVGKAVQGAGSVIPPLTGAAMRGGTTYAGGQMAETKGVDGEAVREYLRSRGLIK